MSVFPYDIYTVIRKHLDPIDRCRLSMTCRRLYTWYNATERRFLSVNMEPREICPGSCQECGSNLKNHICDFEIMPPCERCKRCLPHILFAHYVEDGICWVCRRIFIKSRAICSNCQPRFCEDCIMRGVPQALIDTLEEEVCNAV